MQERQILPIPPKLDTLAERLKGAVEQLFAFEQYAPSPRQPLENGEKLAAIVLSTRYRRSSLIESSAATIKKYLDECVAGQKPVELYVMVGGYKQPRLPFSPGIDWAELFNIRHTYALAAELARIHAPGVRITYRFHTILLARINNYDVTDFDRYKEQFQQALDYVASCAPSALGIEARIIDSNSRQEEAAAYARASEKYAHFEQRFTTLDASTQDGLINKSWRNIAWDGVEDWTGLSEVQKIAKAKRALFLDQAFLSTDPITSPPVHDDRITIYSRAGGTHDRLQYGSCSASSVQFWAGVGVFEMRIGKVVPQVLSYGQLASRQIYQAWPDLLQDLDIPDFLKDKLLFTSEEAL